MKITHSLPFLALSTNEAASQQPILIKERWAPLTENSYLAEFFNDYFELIGIIVKETGEQVTIKNKGASFDIIEGINPEMVDYSIEISTENVLNFVASNEDGHLSDEEIYPILHFLLTPITSKMLQEPAVRQNVPGFIKRRENNLHITLHSPDNSESVSHTILYLNKEWIVVPGLHGTPKRIYNMGVQDALLYQKQLMAAIRANDRNSWKTFKKWYTDWRKGVSKVPK